jgi:hypothetical protein
LWAARARPTIEPVVERVEVVIVGLPRMLRDIVESAVAGEPDMELVGTFDAGAPLGNAAQTTAAVLITQSESREEPAVVELLRQLGRPSVLGVSGDGRNALLYQLRPHVTPLGELSPAALVRAIREAARPPAFEATG